MATIRNVLVPTDFSPASDRAVAYARAVANAFGATLHLLHVCENPLAAGAFMDMYTPPSDEDLERQQADAKVRLEALLTEDERKAGRGFVAARTGLPAQEILDHVAEHGAIDLIVIAASGRGLVARLMTGSVADHIVRSAPCPVLTLHPHDREAADAAGHAA